MDPITHGLLGAAVTQALFPRRLGRKVWLIGAAAAMAPDLDILLGVQYHRHFTHSLFFAPIGGLLVAGMILLIWRKFRVVKWSIIAACMAAYFTHGLLDCFTSYGTLWFWPLSERVVAWDTINIIDPLFTLLLLVGVIWASRWIMARPAVAALVCCALYLGLGAVQHERALAAQQSLADERGQVIAHGRVMPTLGNLIVWRSLYRADGKMYADAIRLPPFGAVGVHQGQSLPLFQYAQIPAANRTNPRVAQEFAQFALFADGFTAALPAQPNVVADMRYAIEPDRFQPLWGLTLPVASGLAASPRESPAATFGRLAGDRIADRAASLVRLWHDIRGHDRRSISWQTIGQTPP